MDEFESKYDVLHTDAMFWKTTYNCNIDEFWVIMSTKISKNHLLS